MPDIAKTSEKQKRSIKDHLEASKKDNDGILESILEFTDWI